MQATHKTLKMHINTNVTIITCISFGKFVDREVIETLTRIHGLHTKYILFYDD